MSNEITVNQFKSLKDNKQVRDQAMAMYMCDHFYPTEIADKLHIDIEELGLYVFGIKKDGLAKTCWKYKKDNNLMPQFLQVYEKIKPMYVKKTEKKLLDMVNAVVDNLAKDKDKLLDMDTKDLTNLIASMEKIDRIGRLEEGKATSHTVQERQTFSLREVVMEAKSKKLDDIEDAEVIKLPMGKK